MTSFNLTFKALSDPTRRRILQLLNNGPLSAGEIADQFNMTKPSISHHLNLLKQVDMIMDEKQGQYVIYRLNTTVFQEIVQWLLDFSNENNEEDSEEDKKESGK